MNPERKENILSHVVSTQIVLGMEIEELIEFLTIEYPYLVLSALEDRLINDEYFYRAFRDYFPNIEIKFK